jgi:ABC-2 type transport system ATP-binding protein
MSSADAVIVAENLGKSYPTGFWRRKVRVLSDLSFSVYRNEIVGFLGPNGAGKTTTLKILNHLAFQDSGRVEIFGEDGERNPAVRRRIGFMPEQPYFYEYLTGKEFLSLCGHLTGMGRGEIASRTRMLLDRVGLGEAGGTAIRKYSKGMMQRLGLAQALLHDPELVILDEPMSGLDPMGRMEVRNLIRELKTAGKTVFFSSHIISDVEALCDRVIMLQKGRKTAEGTVEDLVGREIQYVEVVLSPCPPTEWFRHAGLSEADGKAQGDAFVMRARDLAEANGWAERAREAGGRVYSLVPVKKRLEDIYVEQVGGGERGSGHVG